MGRGTGGVTDATVDGGFGVCNGGADGAALTGIFTGFAMPPVDALDGDLPGRGRAIVEEGMSRCAPGGNGNPEPAGKVADRDGTDCANCGGPVGGATVGCDGAIGADLGALGG